MIVSDFATRVDIERNINWTIQQYKEVYNVEPDRLWVDKKTFDIIDWQIPEIEVNYIKTYERFIYAEKKGYTGGLK